MSAPDPFALGGRRDELPDPVAELTTRDNIADHTELLRVVAQLRPEDLGPIALASLRIGTERLGNPAFTCANVNAFFVAFGCLRRIVGHWGDRLEAEQDPVVALGVRAGEVDDALEAGNEAGNLSAEDEERLRLEAVDLENRIAESIATSKDGIALQVCLLRQWGNELEWEEGGVHDKLCDRILAGLKGVGVTLTPIGGPVGDGGACRLARILRLSEQL